MSFERSVSKTVTDRTNIFQRACDKGSLGNVTDVRDDLIITDRGVWCTTLDKNRLEEVCSAYGSVPVSYCPHPMLLLSSGEEKVNNKTLLVISEKVMSQWTSRVLEHFKRGGFAIETVTVNKFKIKTATRKARQTSLVIFDGVTSTQYYYPFISSGVPFFLYNSKLDAGIRDIIRITQTLDLVSNATIYEEYKKELEIVCNSLSDLSRLLTTYSTYMKDMMRWIKRDIVLKNGLGRILIDMKEFKGIILRPWVGSFNNVTPDDVRRIASDNRVKVSMQMCVGLVVTDERLLKHVDGLKARVVRPYIERSDNLFSPSEWSSKNRIVIVTNKMILIELGSKMNEEIDSIPPNCIVVSAPNRKLIESCISTHTPVVTLRSDLTESLLGRNYELFTPSLTPSDVTGVCNSKTVAAAHKRISGYTFTSMEAYRSAINL